MSINDKDFIEKFVELKIENTRLKQERENFIYQSNDIASKSIFDHNNNNVKINKQFLIACITITLMQGNSKIVNSEKDIYVTDAKQLIATPVKIITLAKLCVNATDTSEVDDNSINNSNDKMKDIEKKNDKKNNKQKSNVKRGKASHLLSH